MSNKSTTGPPAAATLDALLQLARDEGTGEVSEEQHQRDKERMLRRLAGAEPRKAPRWGLRVALAALCLSAVALLLAGRSWLQPDPLAFTVQGAHVEDAQVNGDGFAYAQLAAKDEAITLAFEEGSKIVLAPGAQGRLVAVGPHGAELELALGEAQVSIAPRPGARWLLRAGPYLVQVTGTAFRLRWQPERRALAVVMDHGSVIVSGGVASSGVPLAAGQQLTVEGDALQIAAVADGARSDAAGDGAQGSDVAGDGARGDARSGAAGDVGAAGDDASNVGVDDGSSGADAVSVQGDGAAANGAAGPSGAATSPGDSAANGAGAAHGSRAAGSAERAGQQAALSWSQQVARGQFDSVVAEAEARGIDTVLTGAALADLVALADAARYAGKGGLAKRALLAQRGRFAGSSAARAAAFLLGRMADSAGQPGQALHHYQTYLAEGGGPLSREALGRAMLASQRSGQHAQAKQLARRYLKQHPKGPHARSARRLLGTDKDEAMP